MTDIEKQKIINNYEAKKYGDDIEDVIKCSEEEYNKVISEYLSEKYHDNNNNNNKRPTWDEYFMKVCDAIAERATCDRGKSGCVIAKDNQILVTGYVGSPHGLPHCDEVGHLLKKTIHEDGTATQHCVRTVHAEQNAICQAAKKGISINGATVYCKMTPCRTCAMLLINCGIKRIVCNNHYHDEKDSLDMFRKVGIAIEHIEDNVQQYKDM